MEIHCTQAEMAELLAIGLDDLTLVPEFYLIDRIESDVSSKVVIFLVQAPVKEEGAK